MRRPKAALISPNFIPVPSIPRRRGDVNEVPGSLPVACLCCKFGRTLLPSARGASNVRSHGPPAQTLHGFPPVSCNLKHPGSSKTQTAAFKAFRALSKVLSARCPRPSNDSSPGAEPKRGGAGLPGSPAWRCLSALLSVRMPLATAGDSFLSWTTTTSGWREQKVREEGRKGAAAVLRNSGPRHGMRFLKAGVFTFQASNACPRRLQNPSRLEKAKDENLLQQPTMRVQRAS